MTPVICRDVENTPLSAAETPTRTSSGSSCRGACNEVLSEWCESACPPRPRRTRRSSRGPGSASARPPRVRQATIGSERRVPRVQARKMAIPPVSPRTTRPSRATTFRSLASVLRSSCRLPLPRTSTAWSTTMEIAIRAVPTANSVAVPGLPAIERRSATPNRPIATTGTTTASSSPPAPATASAVRTRTRRRPWSVSGSRAMSSVPSPQVPRVPRSSIAETAAPATPTEPIGNWRAAISQNTIPRRWSPRRCRQATR